MYKKWSFECMQIFVMLFFRLFKKYINRISVLDILLLVTDYLDIRVGIHMNKNCIFIFI